MHLLCYLLRIPKLLVPSRDILPGVGGVEEQLTWIQRLFEVSRWAFIKHCPHLLLGAPGAQVVIHFRELRILLGTDVPIWFSIWPIIIAQLCLTSLVAQLA